MAVQSSKTCRLCLEDEMKNIDIFSRDCAEKSLSKMIHRLFSFWIKPSDILPKFLCTHCIRLVKEYYNFSVSVKECQKILSKKSNKLNTHVNGSSSLSKELIENTASELIVSNLKNPLVKIEIRDISPSEFGESGITNHTEAKDWTVAGIPIKLEDCLDDESAIKSDCDKYESLEPETVDSLSGDSINIDDLFLENKLKSKTKKVSKETKREILKKKSIKNRTKNILSSDINITQNVLGLNGIPVEIFKNGKLMVKGPPLDDLMNQFYDIYCDLCVTKQTFNQISKLFQHFEEEHGTKGYVICCKSRLYKRQKICMHMARHVQPSAFECPICNKPVSRPKYLKIHLQTHLPSSEKSFKCDTCDKRYSGIDGLNSHKLTHVPIEDRKAYDCKICGKRFTLPKSYFGHIRSVHSNIKYLCAECGRSFQTKSNLTLHMSTHDPEGRNIVQCPHCSFLCKSKQYLERHIKIHSSERIHCTMCDFSTHLKSQLYKHTRVRHSEEKPFVCVVCGKQFKLKIGLQTHMSQHTGERRYSCSYCPKTFVSSGNYYTHRRRMHPDQYIKKSYVRTIELKPSIDQRNPEVEQEISNAELARQQIKLLDKTL